MSRVNSRAAHPSSSPRNTKSRVLFSLNPDRENGKRERVNISSYRVLGEQGESEITKTKTSSQESAHMMRHKHGLTLAAVVAVCRLFQCVGLDRGGKHSRTSLLGAHT